MSEVVTIKDKQFEKFIEFRQIQTAINRIAREMDDDLRDKNPLFIAVLNGAFMFAGELMKEVTVPCEITFVRLASYQGTSTTNKVREVLGLNESIGGRTVVIVEDIVDSGNTMVVLKEELNKFSPKEIKIATLLLKPDALKQKIHLDYVALEIPNDFIVGYGLDYDGYGRNLKDIYKIKI
ncbi:MAG: hypoxanthine phosphoribosyltransferase [Petrimonas sp.]|nr:hypoxanthine phosphoribosyltransferase [Petrimonas sp.]